MDVRYLAGLFDGEGYIRIAKYCKPNSDHVRYQLYGGIGMCCRPLIERLQKECGGSMNQNRHDLRNPKARIQFTWVVCSRQAYEFMLRIRKHVIVKAPEVELAIAFQEHVDAHIYIPGGRRHMLEREHRDTILAEREAMFQRLSVLKQVSYPPLLLKDGPRRAGRPLRQRVN